MQLITDRNKSDVTESERILAKVKSGQSLTEEESEALFSGLKGCYNITDINRVNEAMRNIYQRWANKELPFEHWQQTDIFKKSDWEKYLSDMAFIRSLLPLPPTVPQVPTLKDMFSKYAYERANDIEKILLSIDYYITQMVNAYYYCGEIYAGEV